MKQSLEAVDEITSFLQKKGEKFSMKVRMGKERKDYSLPFSY